MQIEFRPADTAPIPLGKKGATHSVSTHACVVDYLGKTCGCAHICCITDVACTLIWDQRSDPWRDLLGSVIGRKNGKMRTLRVWVSEKWFEPRSGMQRNAIALRKTMEKEEVILMARGYTASLNKMPQPASFFVGFQHTQPDENTGYNTLLFLAAKQLKQAIHWWQWGVACAFQHCL